MIVVLNDGGCSFCSSKVRWVLTRDRRAAILFASLTSQFAQSTGMALNEESMMVIRIGNAGTIQVFERSNAVLEVMKQLGILYRGLACMASFIPKRLRDPAYDLVAKRRHQLRFVLHDIEPQWAGRFVDEMSISDLLASRSEIQRS